MPETDANHPQESDREVVRIFRKYAHDRGWNDHPLMVAQRVAAWRESGGGPVEDAVRQHRRTARLRVPGRAVAVVAVTLLPGAAWLVYAAMASVTH